MNYDDDDMTVASGLEWLASLKSPISTGKRFNRKQMAAIHAVRLGQDDLRDLAIPGVDEYNMCFVLRALTARGQRAVSNAVIAAGCVPGPLADLQVYGSNLLGRYGGKSHAFDCSHHHASQDIDLLTLPEFLPIYGAAPRGWSESLWCGQCGGFSIQRLTDEQKWWMDKCAVLGRVREVVDHYEKQLDDLRARKQEMKKSESNRSLEFSYTYQPDYAQTARYLGEYEAQAAELVEQTRNDPTMHAAATELRDRANTLKRKYALRGGN